MLGLAFAMAGPPGGAAGSTGGMAAFQQIIPLVFMFAIFYFLLIRPQQKKAKEHKALLDAIKKGDIVITAGGVHGKVTSVDDNIVSLEIATGVVIKINKPYIASIKRD
ncbi:preprotein translocase subunit YajC [Geobacter sp. SVR]|uniref:preprotein translocase subunit YajC n=1 Tax=Geobacter sp. SVR TaxID=2495594 RepID=UPI00143F0080|nr:preprotein translocase subunit YajC [Geobacter sp. SVR]BCS53784.1 preprotein translocase subunit YajC [Geobacter sp. SVR]GCF85707.1 preprotein translocase subunit YajC [Geobacter sp. SVR]